jgi:glycosyltransferase involved in cell wall biosynthesis
MKAVNVVEQPQLGSGEVFHWIADRADSSIEWEYFSTVQYPRLLRIKRPFLARYVTAFRAVWYAKQVRAELLISHGTMMAIWVGLFKRLLRAKTRHLAWSFTLPYYDKNRLMWNAVMRFGVKDINRFIMYSMIETENYPEYLKLPADRFRMIPWTMNKPAFDRESTPLIKGRYVAAMGSEGRDYKTLIQAMSKLPEIKLVIVAKPENVENIDIPENIKVWTNIPYEDAMNIAWNSDFMVLPLLSDTIPCGHGSLLAQFLFNKATIVTDSIAMEGYSFPGENVLVYEAQDSDALITQIKDLWEHPEQAENLAKKALDFAESHCSEANVVQYFHEYLRMGI